MELQQLELTWKFEGIIEIIEYKLLAKHSESLVEL